MFKKISMLLSICVLLAVTGCAAVPYAIEGLQAAGHLGAFNSSPSQAKPDLVLGKEIEKFQINGYDVRVNNAFLKGAPCVVFGAYKNGMEKKSIAYLKNDTKDAEEIKSYMQMDEAGKKLFAKSTFLKYGLDLGPIETETAKEEIPAETGKFQTLKSLNPDFPTPGFAPSRTR